MIRRPPRSTQSRSSAASDVYKRQVQHRPRGLVGADLQRPLHRQRRDTVLGRGELPADLKPHRQRRPTSVEQRARRHRRLSLASGALEAAVRDPPTPDIFTSWADEPVRPAKPLQILLLYTSDAADDL